MNIKYNKDMLYWGLSFYFLIGITYFIYLPGTSGIFLFDDVPNLSPMGQYKDLSNLDNFFLFILEGFSGPTGRPISLATFFLNDNTWPSQPRDFIRTNILIHLINGVLLFWLSIKLSRVFGFKNNSQLGFSLLVTAFWILHPMHTTSVLYVIQRMTILSATFMLVAILFYLYGRQKMFYHRIRGLSILFLGVGTFLILAILSKENGILLVTYILVIEFFLFRPFLKSPPKSFNFWLIPAIVLPFIALIVYLALMTNPDSFMRRDFSLSERLLTETRILLDYLKNIILPDMRNITIFHDDFEISKNLFTPWTTLPSIAIIVSGTISIFILRKRYPVLTFGLAWFLAGHLIESTVIPLELYFEHRNYLPMLGIFITISWYLISFYKTKKTIVIAIISIILILNSFILYQSTTLWGKPYELSYNWFLERPNSERTRLLYLSTTEIIGIKPSLLKNKKPLSKTGSQFYATSILLELKNACINNKISENIIRNTLDVLGEDIIHISANSRLKQFIEHFNSGACKSFTIKGLEKFLLNLAAKDNIKNTPLFAHDIHYYLSTIYMKNKNLNLAMKHIDLAYEYHPTINILKNRATYLAVAGLHNEAINVLKNTTVLKTTMRKRLIMKIRQKEIDQIIQTISKAIKIQRNKTIH